MPTKTTATFENNGAELPQDLPTAPPKDLVAEPPQELVKIQCKTDLKPWIKEPLAYGDIVMTTLDIAEDLIKKDFARLV